MTARVHSVDLSRGGVPKNAARFAFVGFEGLAGDRQADRRYHGGPERNSRSG